MIREIISAPSITTAPIIGLLEIPTPYINQRTIPKRYNEFQRKDMSFVDFVFHAFITCGINETAMTIIAAYPMSSIDTIRSK